MTRTTKHSGSLAIVLAVATGLRELKEGSVLFNNALNTLYGVGHMVKNHSDSERGNPLISSKGSYICIVPQTGLHIPQPLLHQSWSTGWNEIRAWRHCTSD